MSNIVTLTAFREALVHCFSMRQPMTVSTRRYRLVFVGMTGHTGNLAVLGLACGQGRHNGVMTSSAHLRSSIRRIHQLQRLMRHVAGCTVLLSHRLRVRLVTIYASRHTRVTIVMAEITCKIRMLAGLSDELFVWFSMACITNSLVLPFQLNVEGFMRIVATEAVFYFVVSSTFMAVTALRNVFGGTRAVPFVACLTIDLCLVGGTVCSDFSRLLSVTLSTVIDGQNRLGDSHRTQRKERDGENKQSLQLNIEHLSTSLE